MIAGLIACLVLAAVAAEGGSTETIFHGPPVRFEKDGCTSGLYRGIYVSPFAVPVSCEDALGSYLSVVYSGTMGAPADGAWQIGVREWHEPEWGDDVTSYTWGAEGERLYVATSGAYGSGSVYALDLREKKSRRGGQTVSQARASHAIGGKEGPGREVEGATKGRPSVRQNRATELAPIPGLVQHTEVKWERPVGEE